MSNLLGDSRPASHWNPVPSLEESVAEIACLNDEGDPSGVDLIPEGKVNIIDPAGSAAASMSDALISVVIPAYNVAEYIEECLESILTQKGVNLEVIVVDDESTDGTSEIIDEFATRDSRIRVVHQKNMGPGGARNVGIDMAQGEFLAFVDPDDYLLEDAYATMLASIMSNNADFVTANVLRLQGGALTQSNLHEKVIAGDQNGVHISDHAEFIWDTVVWNKLYRLQFYREKVGPFAHMLYEDMLPMCKAHVLARGVNTLTRHVYVWRQREDKSSITQDRLSAASLTDRLKANADIWAYLKQTSAPHLVEAFEAKQLSNDLFLYFPSIPRADEKFRDVFFSRLREFVLLFSPESFRHLTLPEKLVYELLKAGRIHDIEKLLPYRGYKAKPYDVIRQAGRFIAKLPFQDGWNALPDHLYDVTDALKFNACASGAALTPTGCRISIRASVEGITASTARNCALRVYLADQSGKELFPLYIARQSIANGTGSVILSLDVDIDFLQLAAAQAKRRVVRHVVTEITIGHFHRIALVGIDPKTQTKWQGRQFNGWIINPEAVDGTFLINAVPFKTLLLDFQNTKSEITFTLQTAVTVNPAFLRLFYPRTGAIITEATLEQEGQLLKCTIPGAALEGVSDDANLNISVTLVEQNGKRHRVWCTRELALPQPIGFSGMLGELCYSPSGNLNLKLQKNAVRISSASFEGGSLLVKGETVGTVDEQGLPLVFVNNENQAEYPLYVHHFGGKFEAAIQLAHVQRAPGCFGPLPLGTYALSFSKYHKPRQIVAHCEDTKEKLVQIFAGLECELQRSPDHMVLQVRNRLADNERGATNQQKLQAGIYTASRKKPTVPLVLFDSWNGKRIDDSPYAIYNELNAQKPELDLVFVTTDAGVYVPPGVKTVRKWSAAYWEALGTARLIVFNDRLPGNYIHRPGQYLLQTWHGTPIKKIGHDITDPKFDKNYLISLSNEVPKWSMLISPNATSTGRLKSAFQFKGEVMETGYPRNDVLSAPDRDQIREQVRASLGIKPGELCIFYAPTWRDTQKLAPGKYAISLIPDLDAIQKAMPSSQIIFRAHHLMVADVAGAKNKRIKDVSSYPDVALLYLAADVLISDYSSVIVDYSVTGKPILFYVPDFDEYSTDVRGFYGDFASEAPGPFLKAEADLIAALLAVQTGKIQEQYAELYGKWQAKYCHLDDGKASSKVVKRIMPLLS